MKDITKNHFSTLATNEEKILYEIKIKTYPYPIVAQSNPKMSASPFYQRILMDIRTAFQN